MNEIIDKLGGIETFGILSLCLFVVVFIGSMLLAFCVKKPFLNHMSALPLDEEQAKIEENHLL